MSLDCRNEAATPVVRFGRTNFLAVFERAGGALANRRRCRHANCWRPCRASGLVPRTSSTFLQVYMRLCPPILFGPGTR